LLDRVHYYESTLFSSPSQAIEELLWQTLLDPHCTNWIKRKWSTKNMLLKGPSKDFHQLVEGNPEFATTSRIWKRSKEPEKKLRCLL